MTVAGKEQRPQIAKSEITSDSGRGIFAVALLVIVCAFIYEYVQDAIGLSVCIDGVRYFCLRDDPMICMRYAYNLASGIGLVWNAGERVEGITNLGWTLIMAAVHLMKIPLPYTSLVIQLLNLACSLAILKVIYSYLRLRTSHFITLLGVSMTAFNAPLIASGVCGFESILQSLLITIVLLKLLPNREGNLASFDLWCIIPVLLGVAYFVRPDTVAIAAPIIVLLFARAFRQLTVGGKKPLGKLILSSLIGMTIMAAVVIFQKQYYGDFLPNTYYLKIEYGAADVSRGFDYFLRFLFEDNQAVIFAGTILYMLRGLLFSPSPRSYLYGFIPIISWFSYVVMIGGDWMNLSRFFVIVIPALVACSMLLLSYVQAAVKLSSIEDLVIRTKRFLYQETPLWKESIYICCLAIFTGIVFSIIFSCRNALAEEIQYLCEENTSLIMMAKAIEKNHVADGKLIGVIWAGILPYFMPNQKFHDMLGYSDKYIAHTESKWGAPGHCKWDFDYSLDKVKPDLLITRAFSMTPMVDTAMAHYWNKEADFSFNAALWFHPSFISFYQPNRLPLVFGNTRPFMQDIYLRKE